MSPPLASTHRLRCSFSGEPFFGLMVFQTINPFGLAPAASGLSNSKVLDTVKTLNFHATCWADFCSSWQGKATWQSLAPSISRPTTSSITLTAYSSCQTGGRPTLGPPQVSRRHTLDRDLAPDAARVERCECIFECFLTCFGPASDALDHFSGMGYTCPPRTNPAEFLLDLVTGADIGEETASMLPQMFSESPAQAKAPPSSVPKLETARSCSPLSDESPDEP